MVKGIRGKRRYGRDPRFFGMTAFRYVTCKNGKQTVQDMKKRTSKVQSAHKSYCTATMPTYITAMVVIKNLHPHTRVSIGNDLYNKAESRLER